MSIEAKKELKKDVAMGLVGVLLSIAGCVALVVAAFAVHRALGWLVVGVLLLMNGKTFVDLFEKRRRESGETP